MSSYGIRCTVHMMKPLLPGADMSFWFNEISDVVKDEIFGVIGTIQARIRNSRITM